MDVEVIEVDRTIDKINFLINSLSNFAWMKTADENVIDVLFGTCAEIKEIFLQEEERELYKEVISQYYWIDFTKAVEILIQNIIKNPCLNEQLTCYALRKYADFYPQSSTDELLEEVLEEVEGRQNLVELLQKTPEGKVVNVEWRKTNSLISDITLCKSEECDSIILQALRGQTQVLLNAIDCASLTVGHSIIQKVIRLLESQSDLKLWFTVMKLENIDLVLKLCTKFKSFFQSVLRFFDKFAAEIETSYDEELNVKYSHLNLDFDEFLEVLQAFLNDEKFNEKIREYLENKILFEEDSFLFWIDVKACLSCFQVSS